MTRKKLSADAYARHKEARQQSIQRYFDQCDRKYNRAVISRCDYWNRDNYRPSWVTSPLGERDRYYRLAFRGRRYLAGITFSTDAGTFQLFDTTYAQDKLLLRRRWLVHMHEPGRSQIKAEMHEQLFLCMRHLQGVLDSAAVLAVL